MVSSLLLQCNTNDILFSVDIIYLEDLGKLILEGRGPPRHFCRIINNFLLFDHGQLISTILQSLSKRRVVCLEQETTYVAASRLVVAASQLALSFALPSPHPPTEGYPKQFLLSAPLKIASQASKMLLAYSGRSDREEHAVLHYPNAGNRLNCWRLIYKKRQRPLFIAYLGEGVGTNFILSAPTFYFSPPPLESQEIFRQYLLLRTFFFFVFTEKSRWVPLNPSCWYKSQDL